MSKGANQSVFLGETEKMKAQQEKREFEELKKAVCEGLKNFEERDYQWLWRYIEKESDYFAAVYEENESMDIKINNLVRAFKKDNFKLSEILADHSEGILSMDEFKWIDPSNYRQIIFVMHSILEDIKNRTPIPDEKHFLDESLFKQIFYYFDVQLFGIAKRHKLRYMQEFKLAWTEKTTPAKYSKWLISGDKHQLKWAFEYLLKKEKLSVNFKSHQPEEHFYALILASLDHMDWKANFFENHIFIDKMKKAWSLQKFRIANKGKNQYHLPLTKQTKKKLEELALLYGTKTSNVLEGLIKEDYSKKMLDENGKKRF
jgi:hypothetical protein